MKEIEAKFLNINKKELINKLEKIGANKAFDEILMRRVVFQIPNTKYAEEFLRLRDEGDKTTLTYKKKLSLSLSGMEEIETVVEDFDTTRKLLNSLDMEEKNYQENRRMRYVIEEEEVEFDIDTWPGLEPYLEIEAKDEKAVEKYASILNLDMEDAVYGSALEVYIRVYNITVDWFNNECSNLTFNNIPKELRDDNQKI